MRKMSIVWTWTPTRILRRAAARPTMNKMSKCRKEETTQPAAAMPRARLRPRLAARRKVRTQGVSKSGKGKARSSGCTSARRRTSLPHQVVRRSPTLGPPPFQVRGQKKPLLCSDLVRRRFHRGRYQKEGPRLDLYRVPVLLRGRKEVRSLMSCPEERGDRWCQKRQRLHGQRYRRRLRPWSGH